MALITCPECNENLCEKAIVCPKCGNPMKPMADLIQIFGSYRRGFEWKTKTEILGWPLMHIAIGRDKKTGRLLIAKGIIAIGQFGIGVITIAQFGIGILFGLGQFTGGIIAIGQFALGLYFGLGQFATGFITIGQLALGKYALAQMGFGEYIWSTQEKNPLAIKYFKELWNYVKNFIGIS